MIQLRFWGISILILHYFQLSLPNEISQRDVQLINSLWAFIGHNLILGRFILSEGSPKQTISMDSTL